MRPNCRSTAECAVALPGHCLQPPRCPMSFSAPDPSGPPRQSVDAKCAPAHLTASGRARGHSGWAFGWVSTDWRDGPDRSGATETMSCRACAKAPDRAGRRRIWPSTDSLVAKEVNQIAGVEAVCFGDFHLGQQMKVTRPPGRIPGRLSNENGVTAEKTRRQYLRRRFQKTRSATAYVSYRRRQAAINAAGKRASRSAAR